MKNIGQKNNLISQLSELYVCEGLHFSIANQHSKTRKIKTIVNVRILLFKRTEQHFINRKQNPHGNKSQ